MPDSEPPATDAAPDSRGSNAAAGDGSARTADHARFFLAAIVESSEDSIITVDFDGIITSWNKAAERLYGYRADEAIGKSLTALVLPDNLGEVLGNIENVKRSRNVAIFDSVRIRKGGRQMHLEVVMSPVKDDAGDVIGVSTIARDVTERRVSEKESQETEARFRSMLEQANVGIVQIADGGGFLAVNPGFCRIVGRSADELRQLRVADVTHPDDYPREVELTRQLVAGEISHYAIEKRYVRPEGTVCWGSMTATLVRDSAGAPLYTVAIIQRIEEQKRAEEALRASEERFRTVTDMVPQLIWTNDAQGRANYFNRRWHEYSGLSYEQSVGGGWQNFVHPDDAASAVRRWQQALAAGEVFEAEYRLRRHDGVYRWHIGRNVPLRTDGQVLSWFGTATDIDELKQAQSTLYETEEKFRLLVEGAPDYAMFLLDTENNITYWSGGAETVFGWTPEEAIGRKGSLIFVEEDLATGGDQEELAIALREGSAPDRRWHVRKDGTRLWLDGFMRRLNHDDGTLRGFAKIAREATEQKMAEERLRQAHDELEQRVHHRTKELQAMNESLEQEMMRRQKLEREILEVTERERAAISQDLHDSLCQELTATAFLLKSRAKSLGRTDPEAGEALTESAQMVNRNAGLARDLARGLHPLELGSGGLVSALRELASRTNETVSCRCECPRSLRLPSEAVAVNLYRIAQEAVTNALKHAKPSEVVICIERIKDEIHLVISDNGTRRRKSRGNKGLGIQMMQYRANVSGGSLRVEAKRGKGTKVTCRVPVTP